MNGSVNQESSITQIYQNTLTSSVALPTATAR